MKRKEIVRAVTTEPRRIRNRKPRKKLPEPYKEGQLVSVKSPHQFTGIKLGWVMKPCKYDEGIVVFLVESTQSNAIYRCIQPDTIIGDEIVILNKSDG